MSTAKSVLLVANYESDVGYAWWLMEHFWRSIAVAAKKGRIRCLLTYPVLRQVPEAVATAPIEVMEFRFSPRTWREVWHGLQLIRRRNICAIYLTDWPYFHPSYFLWRLCGVKQIVIHDHTPGDRPALDPARAVLKQLLHATRAFAATHYVAVSPYIARRLRENCQVPERRIITVTNGIPPFSCAHAIRRDVRARLGVAEDTILIAMVSRATRYKNLDFAVQCLAKLHEDPALRGRFTALHCGDGPDLEAFRALAAASGASDAIRFLGRRSDVRDILCASDIAFHPSKGEAMSLAILEFMNAELAVLTSNLPSVSTAIDPESSGLTYEHGSGEDACRQLRRLIEQPWLRRALGTEAAKVARTRFTQQAMDDAFAAAVVPILVPRA